ncbi:hypothetical protein ERO13_A12G112501v2 [Gossypium hirsutum]|nr:hypothetical protein ERO13_A12G112501v2 [Gossypium hirsutum]
MQTVPILPVEGARSCLEKFNRFIKQRFNTERPYGGATLVTWRPSVGISREKLTF